MYISVGGGVYKCVGVCAVDGSGSIHCLTKSFLDQFTHSAVVDTALVFPHPRGLPYKRALKSLIAEHLHRFIQDNIGQLGDPLYCLCHYSPLVADGGHDSHEDAAACMELMLWKVKTDMLKKTRR